MRMELKVVGFMNKYINNISYIIIGDSGNSEKDRWIVATVDSKIEAEKVIDFLSEKLEQIEDSLPGNTYSRDVQIESEMEKYDPQFQYCYNKTFYEIELIKDYKTFLDWFIEIEETIN